MKIAPLAFLGLLGLTLSGCISNPNTLAGTGLGAIGGGLLGQGIGQGKGRLVATGVGTILGAFVGNHLGTKFDGVTHNQNAINRNQLGINQNANSIRDLSSQQGQGSQSFYFGNGGYQSRQHSIPLNCSVRNNYIVCNGS